MAKKTSVKIQRLQELVRRDLAQLVTTRMRDPRLKFGCITKVELTRDLKHAKVFVSCLGSDADRRTYLRGLESARGKLQKAVGNHLRTRQTPRLHFTYDDGIERSVRLGGVIDRAVAADREAQLARGEIDEDGNPIDPPAMDADGNPIDPPAMDADGNPIDPLAMDAGGEPIDPLAAHDGVEGDELASSSQAGAKPAPAAPEAADESI